jgi:hypothetical protein
VARKARVKLEAGEHWFSLGYAAALLGTTQKKLRERAVAGEFKSQEDAHGLPAWLREREIAAERSKLIPRERARRPRAPRAESASQMEAQWARQSLENQSRYRRGGAVSAHFEKVLLAEIGVDNAKKSAAKGGREKP